MCNFISLVLCRTCAQQALNLPPPLLILLLLALVTALACRADERDGQADSAGLRDDPAVRRDAGYLQVYCCRFIPRKNVNDR